MITVFSPIANFNKYQDVILVKIKQVLETGWYILGQEVRLFEKNFAKFCCVDYCVGVGNGTMAIAIALKAVGVEKGDEVITVSFTSVATIAAIELIGAVPVFVDIKEDSYTMDPNEIKRVISPKTKAILPVHLYGCPCDIEQICNIAVEFNLKVVEDCCQAHGATFNHQMVGSFGDAGAFSFYPTKNLGALGDAGAIITKNQETYEKALALRQYGWKEKQNSLFPGFNSRLDEIQAGILNVKLPYLNEELEKRKRIAEQYTECCDGVELVSQKINDLKISAWHLFVMRGLVTPRKTITDFLSLHNIQTAIHYPLPVHLQQGYLNRIRGHTFLPITEKVSNQIFTIPLYPELSDEDVQHICSILKQQVQGPLTWNKIQQNKNICLYLGQLFLSNNVDVNVHLIGISYPENSNDINIHHDITKKIPLSDNSVNFIQSEDVFEHIPYDKMIDVLNEMYRILKPGGLFRISVPDYNNDFYYTRSIKNDKGDIVFDYDGGIEEGQIMGHKWFPTYVSFDKLLRSSFFETHHAKIEYLHCYITKTEFIIKDIDYSKGRVVRTPDFDERAQNPKRPLSIVVDIIK